MGLRTERVTTPAARAVLVGTFVLLGYSTGSAQSLTATANPASGAAGVNNSYLTGSGFPAGAITDATVAFGQACAAPAVTTSPVLQVTTVGALRRFQFAIPGSLAPGTYKLWLLGKAGTTNFNTLTNRSCANLTVTASVKGTASLGAAISGAAVTLVDSQGNTVSGTTASDGTFALPTAGLVPPFLVKVVTTAPSGSFPAGTTLYSVSADANASTRINVTTLTDLILRTFYAAEGINPDNAFAAPTGGNAPPDPIAVQSIADLVIPGLALWLDGAGVTATSGPGSADAINLISSPLIAYQPGVTPPDGLDAVLHKVTSETLNPNGSVAQMTIVGGTITETITPSVAGNLVTMTTTTVNSANGAGSGGSFSGFALTPAQQPIIDGINATLTAYRNVVNSKGVALTGADLLPFYAPDFLQSGINAQQDAANNASEIAGGTFTDAHVTGLLDVNGNLVKVNVFFAVQFGADSDSGSDHLDFKNVGGTWLLAGNQRVADVGAFVQARRGQGGAAAGQAASTYAFAGTTAPLGVVTSSTITGPVNNPGLAIWNGATSQALFHGAQFFQNGQPFDQFFLLSSALGNTFAVVNPKVPAGSPFNFNLTTTSGNVQYAVKSGAFTTENLAFIGLPANTAAVDVPLSSVVNHTINFTFSLPRTFATEGVFLFAQIFDGLPNDPAAHGCGISADSLNLNWQTFIGTGSITFPATLAACSNLNSAVTFVNVFLEADGVNGESSLVQLAYPY